LINHGNLEDLASDRHRKYGLHNMGNGQEKYMEICKRCGWWVGWGAVLTCEEIQQIAVTHKWEKHDDYWVCKICGTSVVDVSFPPAAQRTCQRILLEEALG
jgi:rubredoxin